MPKRVSKKPAVLALATALSFTPVDGFSQTVGDGCDNVNGATSPTPPATNVGSFPPFYDGLSWQAGETISAVVSAPISGATTVQIQVPDGNVVASASVPGVVSYVFPADVEASYRFTTGVGQATYELSCTPPPSPSAPPTPVPALGLWGIGILSALIALMGLLVSRGKKA